MDKLSSNEFPEMLYILKKFFRQKEVTHKGRKH